MKTRILTAALVLSLFTAGCSSKKYYEPEEVHSLKAESSRYSGEMIDLTRDGATLDSGSYIGQDGVSEIALGEGFRFLSQSKKYILASNIEGNLKILDKKSGETVRLVALHTPVVSAAIAQGKVAYILNDNTFGIYEIRGNRKTVENRSSHSFAIDTRAATPMFVDKLVVMPMLDGKIIIVNHTAPHSNSNAVYISSKKLFNNVIYLSRIGNTMIAATPNAIITLSSAGKKEYRANISEVTTLGKAIYIFTKEGEVIKLSEKMRLMEKMKFKFAHFSLATAFDGKVFALDQQGSLIVMNRDLSKYKVYDLGAVDIPAYVSGSTLYKDGKAIALSSLTYE